MDDDSAGSDAEDILVVDTGSGKNSTITKRAWHLQRQKSWAEMILKVDLTPHNLGGVGTMYIEDKYMPFEWDEEK
eukprot:8553795-Ditylum_brightwellii.AAC.1